MRELLYLEVPTRQIAAVCDWLHHDFQPAWGQKHCMPAGIRLAPIASADHPDADLSSPSELSIFVWSVQQTTYLKAFRWGEAAIPGETGLLRQLQQDLRQAFPCEYPAPPEIDLSSQTIFEALAATYPKTVRYFQRMPNGEADLQRVYWWEQRWRQSVRSPQQPDPVITSQPPPPGLAVNPDFDLIYVGGALGAVHAAVMAQLGYRVLLLERLPFGRMNREWNISRSEFQSLIDLKLFTAEEFEELIAAEYVDGFHKFFDANNPPQCKAPILHTPTVLNIAVDGEKLLRLCGDKLLAAGGEIWDETEFLGAEVYPTYVAVETRSRRPEVEPATRRAIGRLLVDAMGTASPITWQLNGKRTFDSVCPTVGACISGGFEPGVWDSQYGDVLNSHGDTSRGRQLIWELFPGRGGELTVYLFHYHEVHPDNPGSLLEMYEDFFNILPEYRRCDLDKLTWRKATFGYIPGYFSLSDRDRTVAFDRLVAIGDAASLQSPLVFTGFGSLVRNLPRLTTLLHTALTHDLLDARSLNRIRAYQSNVAVTWLFSKGMMVPTGRVLPPERINSMLNTFFGVLGSESPEVAEQFIKDRAGWLDFNRMALKAAWQNPAMLSWIWDLAGAKSMVQWTGNYLNYTVQVLVSRLLQWLPAFVRWTQGWLEPLWPSLWFTLLAIAYDVTYGMGRPVAPVPLPVPEISRDRPVPPRSAALVPSPRGGDSPPASDLSAQEEPSSQPSSSS